MAAPDDIPAMRFGNYEVLTRPDGKPDELGRGGFGRTYRARHVFLGTEVALKVIIDRLAFDEAAKKRFLKEAREAARLSHPGIARITDFGEAEGTFFYAMELCRDGDLKEYVRRRGALPPAEALELIRQTTEALGCAHTHGILHRDIKPSNLLVVMENGVAQVKLIDFGLVRRIAQGADETMEAASPSQWSPVFASPEQIRELPLDERTDIFSLGMTAWFLLRGSGPVDGNTHEIVAERLGPEGYEPRLPGSLQGAARAVVARMLEKDAARRFRQCAEVLEELRRAASGAPAAPARGAQSLQDRFALQPAGREYAGEVFRGHETETGRRVRVTKVYREHEPETLQAAAAKVKALAAMNAPGLVPVLEMAEFSDGVAIIEEEVSGRSVEETLRREGAVPLSRLATILWEAASGADAAVQCGAVPGALDQAVLTGAERSPVDWTAAQIFFPVKVIADNAGAAQEADVTAGLEPASPLKSFASLVYLGVGGRHVRPQALHSSSACIPIPGLSAGGNRLLAGALAGETQPENCLTLLQSLLAAEAVPAEAIARRSRERQQKVAADRAATADRAARTATGTRTGTAPPVSPPPASPPAPGVTQTVRTEFLDRIAAATRQAKESSDATLRVKLPPGRDDAELCQFQIEARKWAREAASVQQRAKEMAESGKLDATAVHDLTDAAAAAAAEVNRLLSMARGLAADVHVASEETQFEPLPATVPIAMPPPLVSPVASPPPAPVPAAPRPAPPPVVETHRPVPQPPPQPVIAVSPAPPPPAPVPLIIPPREAVVSKKNPLLAAAAILVLCAAGAGGWYYYQEQQRKKAVIPEVTKNSDPAPVEPPPQNNGTKDPVKVPPKDPDPPPPPPPPPPSSKREIIVMFTGDLPADGDVSFKEIRPAPKITRSGGGALISFELEPGAPIPEPIVNGDRFGTVLVSRAADRLTYKLTRILPGTVRLMGIEARDPAAITIGGKHGVPEEGGLVFKNAADDKGAFKLDAPSWRFKTVASEVEPGVWESVMKLSIQKVNLTAPASGEVAWRKVIFTAVNPGVMPDFSTIRDSISASSVGTDEIEFDLEPDLPPFVQLPAGGWNVSWISKTPGVKSKSAAKIDVIADDPFTLPIPE